MQTESSQVDSTQVDDTQIASKQRGGALGQSVDFQPAYNPTLLEPISRAIARESLPFGLNIGRGFDYWHLFELSWLDAKGKPEVAIGRLSVPANSPKIVESKSLKLYCNSLNFKRFERANDVKVTIEKDIGNCVRASVKLELFSVGALPISKLPSIDSLDDLSIEFPATDEMKTADNKLLKFAKDSLDAGLKVGAGREDTSEQIHYTHLFRSNCPVTNQPDWASILVRLEGRAIDEAALLAYFVSFRTHQSFHESCVEQIYADIWTQLKPSRLMVQAWFTRRGGIDINPCRASEDSWIPAPCRLARQ